MRVKLSEQLLYARKMLLHPIDGFYELKYFGKGSILSASLLVFTAFACNIAVLGITNFVFNVNGLRRLGLAQLVLSTLLPYFLWILANYLVSSITKGEGRLIDIYISAAYCLSPYIFFAVPLAIASNVLTMAEEAMYRFLEFVIYCWMGFMFFLQVKEVHNYELLETIQNILWMLFTIAMSVIFSLALFGITVQSANLIIGILREAIGNV